MSVNAGNDRSAVVRSGGVTEAAALRADLLQIIEAAGEVRMFEGRSYKTLWRLLDAATDKWYAT